jgi:hypothetical protein
MTDSEIELTALEWDALRRLGSSAAREPWPFGDAVRERLCAIALATRIDGEVMITAAGRRYIVRGSPLRWDVAA